MDHQDDDRRHPAIIVRVGSREAEIDEEIAPLIREMWIAGIETMMSCQDGGRGKVWLAFDELSEMVRFLNIVAKYEPGVESLYNRMNLQEWPENLDLLWDYELDPSDGTLVDLSDSEPPEDHYHGPPDFYFMFSIRFPPCDLPTVVVRLQQYNSVQEAELKSGP